MFAFLEVLGFANRWGGFVGRTNRLPPPTVQCEIPGQVPQRNFSFFREATADASHGAVIQKARDVSLGRFSSSGAQPGRRIKAMCYPNQLQTRGPPLRAADSQAQNQRFVATVLDKGK